MANHAILFALLLSFFLPVILVLVVCPIIDRVKTRRKEKVRKDRIRRQVIGENLRRR